MKNIPQPYLPPSRAECSCGDARRAAGLLFGIPLGYFSFIYSLHFTPFQCIYKYFIHIWRIFKLVHRIGVLMYHFTLFRSIFTLILCISVFTETVLSCHLHVYSYHLSCLGACCAALRQELSVYVAAYDAGLLKRRYCILCV